MESQMLVHRVRKLGLEFPGCLVNEASSRLCGLPVEVN